MKVPHVHLGRSADNLLGSGFFQVLWPRSVQRRNQKTLCHLRLSLFVLTGFPVSPSLEVSGGIIKATVSEGTELEHLFSFLQTRTELLRGGLACPVRVLIYLLRKVLTLAVKDGETLLFYTGGS